MEWIKLIGILVILVGFLLKLDTIAVVLIAGLATALVSGIDFTDFLSMLGKAFVDNRLVTLFLLTLPMVGISERFGLKQQAVVLIEKIKGLTPGKFLSLYLFIRELAGFFSIRIQGHTQFIRPIVNPMAQAAAENKYGELEEADQEKIKARAAANENYGNFFAQNTFVAASGVLLITGTLKSLGYDVAASAIAQASIPIALIVLVIATLSNLAFDRKMSKKYGEMEAIINNILEFFYILIGLLSIMTAVRVFKDATHPTRLGTATFWLLLGIVFAFGNFIPYIIDGIIIICMGVLTFFKQVRIGKIVDVDEQKAEQAAERIGSKIFIPCISLAVIAVAISYTPLGGQVGIGIASVLALILAMVLTSAKPKTVLDDSDRMFQQVGTAGILPQLLAALGVIFNAAGVGEVISHGISGVVPEGNRLIGVIAYCLGMVLFTMIMGNGFAAFTVITAGIGVPFVIAQGGDPVVAGALAMTAGFCGTLLTPMAANFNALPVALLEMKNSNAVIKTQAPIAVLLIVIHIGLMYFWAF